MTARALLVALIVAGFLPAASAQQMYRWVDKEGRVHYSQQPPSPADAKKVEQRKISAPGATDGQMPFALTQAMKDYPVVLYTSPDCKQVCPDVRALLTRRGVPFREVSVSDAQGIEQLKKATGDDKVPAMMVGTVVHKGFEPNAFNDALDVAGYPRTPLPGVKLPSPTPPAPAQAPAPPAASNASAPSPAPAAQP